MPPIFLEATRETGPLSAADLPRLARAFGHDLREQLGLLSVCTQLLRRRAGDRLAPEEGRLLDQSAAAIARTERLIADLIAYLRLGSRAPAGGRASGEEALARVLTDLAPRIESAGAVVRHEALHDVSADPAHLQEVLLRLVDNALKFRGEAPPVITVHSMKKGSMAAYRVQDNGIGIEPRYAAQIFEPLKRLHGHRYEGTGMGLAFCQAIVGLYGGSMKLESEPGRGAAFTFTLPLAPEAA